MPPISNERISSIVINEDTGELALTLPDYEDTEYVTTYSLLLIAISERIASDPEWVDKMVDEAANLATAPTTH